MSTSDKLGSRVKCRLCRRNVASDKARLVVKEFSFLVESDYDRRITDSMLSSRGDYAGFILMSDLGVKLEYYSDLRGNVYVCNDCARAKLITAAEAYLRRLDEKLKKEHHPDNRATRHQIDELRKLVMFCTRCGNEYAGDPNFCTRCGAKLGEGIAEYLRSHKPQSDATGEEALLDLEAKLLKGPSSYDRHLSAAHLAADWGDKGLAVLLRALESEDHAVFFPAAKAINDELIMKKDPHLDKALYESLKPGSDHLASIVSRRWPFPRSAIPWDEKTSGAVVSLRYIGNESAIPALDQLRTRLESTIATEGETREYVRTEYAAGTVTNKDYLEHIKSAVGAIKFRASLLGQ